MLLLLLTVSALAETKEGTIGVLSYLNMSEDEIQSRYEAERLAYQYLEDHGVIEFVREKIPQNDVILYDSMDAMLMSLMSGEVIGLNVPSSTAQYLCAVNDRVEQDILYHPEKAEGFSQDLLNRICIGYSFMMLEKSSDLRDQFDKAIEEMKADGTMEKLIKTHITDVAKSGEPEVVFFEQFEGDPIRVAVTGSLPPMDYVAADGTPAGFNTAVLAEIGKRLGKNIELVQVDSVGRALALAKGNVDVVFWTRGRSEGSVGYGTQSMSKKEYNTFLENKESTHTDEENAIMLALRESVSLEKYPQRDMPEGTITTAPYYTDLNVMVTLKD